MKYFMKFSLLAILTLFITSGFAFSEDTLEAQDIPELHMLIFQGDVFISGQTAKTSSLDGLKLDAKINGTVIGSVPIAQHLTGRYSGLELGPDVSSEGGEIEFWIGDQVAFEKEIFGPLTTTGNYCPGCTWTLPISRVLNLHFSAIPQATPTPTPDKTEPSFLTGSLIFGSVLEAPSGYSTITAYSDNELVGTGQISGNSFSITIDPGNVTYVGKPIVFKIANYFSKTTYSFLPDDFQTEFKLFFPEYIAPTPVPIIPTPTPTMVPTAIPTPTPTMEPTRTATPVAEPTATYTATPTPTPIVVSASAMDDSIIEDSSGGCNSRGGGPASVGLILLSLAPVYLFNRKRKNI